jgi:glycosyltransferase involved in cell wall biosynthesis
VPAARGTLRSEALYVVSSDPVVSVVMPFLDAERFIAEAIDSVVAQDFPAWELLLVDDGSTDGSSRIAREAAARDARIRCLEHAAHANRGKSTSRNLGISAARGRYITFLDADDVFLEGKLARQVGLLDSRPAAVMTYGTTEYWFGWDPQGTAGEADRLGKLGVAAGRTYPPPALLVAYLRDPGIVPCICALLVRREAALAVECFDESFQDLYEDQVFIVKLLLHGPVYVDDACGERYRQHAQSSSARAEREGRYHPTAANEARRLFLRWVESYVHAHGRGDRGLRRALTRALRPYRGPWLARLRGR